MKSSLKKLRGLALHNHKHDTKDRNNILPLSQLDELAQATQVHALIYPIPFSSSFISISMEED